MTKRRLFKKSQCGGNHINNNINDNKDKKDITYELLHHNLLIVWESEYNLGIPIIDEQHRGIVTTINSFHYGMRNKHAENMLHPIINMVTEYTRIHFELEESFFEKYEFPDIARHKKLHSELTTELSQIGNKSLRNQDPYQFMEFLKKWWIDHICNKDQVFRDYLLKILDASHNNS